MSEPDLVEQFKRVRPGDFAIIGDPVAHSLSPRMHNPALKNWWKREGGKPENTPIYHTLRVKPGQLGDAIKLIRERGLLGFNVTVPYKEQVCDWLDAFDDFSAAVKAVNTVKNIGGKLHGFNTDADGFDRSIVNDLGFHARGKTALVLGAGGTGAVLMRRLVDLGIKTLYYWNRNPDKVLKFPGAVSGPVRLQTPQEIAREIAKVDLIVNATSVGMKDKDPLPVEGLAFKKDQFVFDVIYNRETAFLKSARIAGAVTVDGLGMLLYQGAKAFEIWTGAPAPLAIMKKGLTTP